MTRPKNETQEKGLEPFFPPALFLQHSQEKGLWPDGTCRITCSKCGQCITHSLAEITITYTTLNKKDIPHIICRNCNGR